MFRASLPAGSQWPKIAAGQPWLAETIAESVPSSLLKLGDTNDESNPNAGSLSRQHATGMRGMRIVLNFVLPSVGATLSARRGIAGC